MTLGGSLADGLRRLRINSSRGFKFQKRSQLFIRPHNETLSVTAMCVCNPDRQRDALRSLARVCVCVALARAHLSCGL